MNTWNILTGVFHWILLDKILHFRQTKFWLNFVKSYLIKMRHAYKQQHWCISQTLNISNIVIHTLHEGAKLVEISIDEKMGPNHKMI